MKKDLDYYLHRTYMKILERDEEGDIIARILELPGCVTHGKTNEEALERLTEVQKWWIQDCLDSNDPVPEPKPQS